MSERTIPNVRLATTVHPLNPAVEPPVQTPDPEDPTDDPLKPSRGIAVAVAMVGPFWAALVWWWC